MNATIEPKVRKHGEQLLAIFPHATERDPVKLCQKLRRLEAKGQSLGLRLCNGPEFEGGYDEVDSLYDEIRHKFNLLMGNYTDQRCRLQGRIAIKLNRDPRGYCLKIKEKDMNELELSLHRDWGGYGIIAPDFSYKG